MKLIRKACFWLAWACLVLGHRFADLAKEGVGEADEYRVGGTD